MKLIIKFTYWKRMTKMSSDITIDLPVDGWKKEIKSCGEITVLDKTDLITRWGNCDFNPDMFQGLFGWNELLNWKIFDDKGNLITESDEIWLNQLMKELDEKDDTDLFFAVSDEYDSDKDCYDSMSNKGWRVTTLLTVAENKLGRE